MTTILPAETSPWQVIDRAIGNQISQNLPGAVQQGYQRQLGLNALDQAQADIAQAGGDPYKIALAFARAGTQNPNLERSLGPLMQTAMQSGRVQNAFGRQPGGAPVSQRPIGSPQFSVPGQPIHGIAGPGMAATAASLPSQQTVSPSASQVGPQGTFATPSPFNIFTPEEINAESERYAGAVNDPNGYTTRFNQLSALNAAATAQRQVLEKAATDANVPAAELGRFMVVNQHLDPRNPSQWIQNALRNYAEVKNNDDMIRRTFIPGIGNGLLGQNREAALKRLEGPIQDNAKRGLEQEDRVYLADNYLTPTEIEMLYHPASPQLEKAIDNMPKGIFPARKMKTWGDVVDVFQGRMDKNPFVSYEEAVERDPAGMQAMQNNLANFFVKNVDKNTSLLGIRDAAWNKKDYDWRQFGPAIRQAQEMGLQLEPFQIRELATIETQPPIQSLPDIFKGISRIPAYLRGAK